MVNGWAKKTIGELFDISGGLSASRAQLSDKGFPYLHYGDIHGSTRTFIDVCSDDNIPCLNIPLKKVSKVSFLDNGDVVFVDASEDDEGACRHIVVRNSNSTPFISGLHTIVAKSKTDELINQFKEFCFQTADVKAQFKFYASGTKVVGVNKSNIKDITIYFPISKDEQHTIATVLSDMDEYITALEKLIAKKQLIKQGVMQELLSGKRRLPGFSGGWEEKQLGELLQYEQPHKYIVSNTEYFLKGTPVLTAGKTLILGYTNETHGIYSNLPVIIFDDFTTESKFINFHFKVKSSAMKLLTSTGICDIRLIYALMQMIDFSIKGHQRYWISEYCKIIVKFPSDKSEQSAIAEVLSDMDAEIDALTAKLDKARDIKQGMMSELLTGRIRLIETEPAKSADEVQPEAETKPMRNVEKPPAVKGHNQQFDDAVMIAGIVNALYSDKYPLGRKKVQKCLYLLRRYQNESTNAFKKKAAGPYADEVRHKGGEPIAKKSGYINTKTNKQGTIFARGKNISQALDYIETWGRQDDIKWVSDNLRFKKVDELELLATVDMASCDLKNDGIPVNLQTIKHLIETNKEWKAKLDKPIFSDANIECTIRELQTLFKGGN